MATIEKWEHLQFAKTEAEVFHLQQRIFRQSKNGKRKQVHKLQKLLVSSHAARCLAVKLVTERNVGRDTAGIDGVKSLTDQQKLQLSEVLNLNRVPSPVKRVWIPKPGQTEKRPLGIPTMFDRAQQALIALALEPEWEARFTAGTYGFRKGRGAHDALVNIRSAIQFKPKWVLDADIEKFFDRVNHGALLAKLETFPQMEAAIRRILKSGILEGSVLLSAEEGTPQGGPLSPLLANIVLQGLETDLTLASQEWKLHDGRRPKHPPRIALYADDFVVLHESREVILKSEEYIGNWLQGMGLNLHPKKTRVVHTLEGDAGNAGFDFLGHRIQQFRTGKYAVKSCFRQIYTHIKPSPTAQKRIYRKVSDAINLMLSGPASRDDERVQILIWRLNPLIRGWALYFNRCNAKQVFTRLDYVIWWKIWKALRRRYKTQGHAWIVETFLRDKEDKWCLRYYDSSSKKEGRLLRFAETPITRHFPVQGSKSYYDGDWPYWSARRGAYPGLPPRVGRLMKAQRGRCRKCGVTMDMLDQVEVRPFKTGGTVAETEMSLVHTSCATEARSRQTGG